MITITEKEFLEQQRAAVNRMREMNERSAFKNQKPHPMPPVPSFVKLNEEKRSAAPKSPPTNGNTFERNTAPYINTPKKENNQKEIGKNSLNIPFLNGFLKDSDSTLIIGLLLLLMSENADKRLLFALVYILL